MENRQYTGCTVNFKSSTVSYKVHKKIYNPTENQQIIPNTQETIISEEVWLKVQEIREHRIRPTATGKTSKFAGLLYCADCGAKLHYCAAKSLPPETVDLYLLLKTVLEITEVKELTSGRIHSLIERIEVHNNDKYDGHCHVKVDIYFSVIGMMYIPDEKEIWAMIDEVKKNPHKYIFVA